MSAGSPPQVTTLPPPPPPQTAPQHWAPRKMSWSPKRTTQTVSALVLIAAVALFVSMALSWFGASVEGHGRAAVMSYYPGNQAMMQGANGTGSSWATYVSLGLIHVGELYQALLVVGLLAGLVALFVAGLGFARAAGVQRFPASSRFFQLSFFILFGLTAALVIVVPVVQPSAYNADFSSTGCGNTPNFCTSVWGSQTVGGVTLSWGMDVGWYVGLFALGLLAIALIVLLMNRRPAVPQYLGAPWTEGQVPQSP
jgi:hypothetical protein